MKKLIILLMLLFVPVSANAFQANIEANWAWNGSEVAGFKFYLDGLVVKDVTDGLLRNSNWTIDLDNGNHLFSMTAYGTKDGVAWESVHSPEYKFEYLYVPTKEGIAPVMYIRIN